MSHLLQILLPGTSLTHKEIVSGRCTPPPRGAEDRPGPGPATPQVWDGSAAPAGGATGGEGTGGEGAAARGQRQLWGGRELGKGSGEGRAPGKEGRAPAAAPPAPRWGGGGGRGRYLRAGPARSHTPGPSSAPPAPRCPSSSSCPPRPPGQRGDRGGLQAPLQTGGGGRAPRTLQPSRRQQRPPRARSRTTGPARQRPPERRGCACRRCPRGAGEGEEEEEGARSPRQVPPSPASPEPRRRGGAAAPRSGHCL